MNVTVNLTSEKLTPSGNVLRIMNGVFITLNFTRTASVILPGFDAEAVSSARLIAAKLTELANEAEQKMAVSL